MDNTHEFVQNYYGKVLSSSKDLKTSACSAIKRPHEEILKVLKLIPTAITDKFFGCGSPLPLGISGCRVLDLGSGSGRDCYAASALVGESGFVTGVDMTEEQVELSREHLETFCSKLGFSKPNMKFVKGFIEFLDKAGIEDDSQDLVISNCVVNLSPDKPRVIREAYRVLAPGGEMYFSDVYCDRRLPDEVRKHEVLWGEGLSGALYLNDFVDEVRRVGFTDPRILSATPIEIYDKELRLLVGETKYYSVTYRLFKLPGLLEPNQEDYGQYAVYKGTINGYEHAYQFDQHNRFEKGKPVLVSGNTAAMLGEKGLSWLSPHFEVFGDRSVHYGAFAAATGDAMRRLPASAPADAEKSSGGGCCG
mmetsp:Transcript_3695/g.8855  ORF Transcript_3695/g.8855 Transcript_3695/m.8855 type:complete len:363 (+) Transcript_3695:108-1196(+)